MAAAFRSLSPVGPQLTPEQEERGWAVMDAFDAARQSGDEHAELAAIGDFLDWQFSVGLMTRERWRELTAPFLLDAIARADEMPAGRALLQRLRDEALEAVNGDDYRERAAGALFILCVDGVQGPRLHEVRRQRQLAARNGVAFVAENAAPCLESGHWALEDVECQLAHAVALLDKAEGGDHD